MHREILTASLLLLTITDLVFIVNVLATLERSADQVNDYTPLQLWELVDTLSDQHSISTGMMDAIRLGKSNQCQDVIPRRAA